MHASTAPGKPKVLLHWKKNSGKICVAKLFAFVFLYGTQMSLLCILLEFLTLEIGSSVSEVNNPLSQDKTHARTLCNSNICSSTAKTTMKESKACPTLGRNFRHELWQHHRINLFQLWRSNRCTILESIQLVVMIHFKLRLESCNAKCT